MAPARSDEVVGQQICTFTAWSSPEAMSEAMRSGTHVRAMQDMFSKELVAGAYTAIYAPVRQFPKFRRCRCGTMARLDEFQGRCQRCETALEALP